MKMVSTLNRVELLKKDRDWWSKGQWKMGLSTVMLLGLEYTGFPFLFRTFQGTSSNILVRPHI